MLRAADVTFAYSLQSTPVLRAVSLDVPAGGFVGVLGPNGSGKTTLLRVLAGTRQPSGGRVTLDGVELGRLPRTALARRMAVVPQDTHLAFDFTALEVVLMGRYPHLATFEVERPRRGEKRPSFWVAARDKLKEFASIAAPPPLLQPAEPSDDSAFAREALAGSVMRVSDPEITAEVAPPEKTLELASVELLPESSTEKTTVLDRPKAAPDDTLELSDSALVARENTEPLPANPAAPSPPKRPNQN